ncbi:MAG: acetamidase/formamidase family protein [Anaerolineaceae bacterium]|nr:acetamidase/formamidase family protein [Anaerolineaceae bacterium]
MPIHIKPEQSHLSFGVHTPELPIKPGKKIFTHLPDAHGFDAQMQQVGGSPNPLVGPFVIPETYPGQTLAVTIHELMPNRPHGWACKNIHPNLWKIPGTQVEREKEYVDWEIDFEKKMVKPQKGYFPEQDIALPLRPVLGCIGVAPGLQESKPSNDCGAFGGNMDFPRIAAGSIIFLPVFVEGAYLYLGDGHALQAAGEINGNGVEVSCDICFSVQVVEHTIYWPRGETSEQIFCMGNSSTLDQAVRIATVEMESWLMESYQMSKDQVGILLGQLVSYEIGNFVSQTYSAACLMPKVFLKSNFG